MNTIQVFALPDDIAKKSPLLAPTAKTK